MPQFKNYIRNCQNLTTTITSYQTLGCKEIVIQILLLFRPPLSYAPYTFFYFLEVAQKIET